MNEALKVMPDESFEAPDLDYDPSIVKPVLRGFWQGDELTPSVHSILYWVDKNDIMGPPPANPANDPQFNHWEIPVQKWWAENSYRYGAAPMGGLPAF